VDFAFTEDQLALRDAVRDFLKGEVTPARLRELQAGETGRSKALWTRLAEIGVTGVLIPEEHGGLGLAETDFVLLLEEMGRAGLAEPVVATAAVGAPLLRELGDAALAARWLPRVAAGEALLAVSHPVNAFTSDAHVADLLLLAHGDELHAAAPEAVRLVHQISNDPSRRIQSVEWRPSSATRVAAGPDGARLLAAALDRGALACAAQLLGVTQQLVDLAVAHARVREQFGRPIGSFQAVKHMLADVQVRLEYARPVVQRAAWSVAQGLASRTADVSQAKAAAGELATGAARTALQVHGAIGYTWEHDLHLWMRRAWSLEQAWGSSAWHRARLGAALLDGAPEGGAAVSFGYQPREGAR
jgi:alkylation response protein AidB-like acyl-CoA dehydrogenase